MNLELDIRGKKYAVDVNSRGKFVVVIGGMEIEAPTFNALRERAMRATKKITPEQAIEFVEWDGKLRRGVCTGRHANGNYLVKYDGGKSEQINPWNLQDTVRPQDAVEFEKLNVACHTADKALKAFMEKRKYDIRRLIDKVVDGAE